MRSIKTVVALTLLAGLAANATPRAALAQTAGCTWYADMALKQQQQNELRKCGFTGPEWNSNRQAHLAWCATQAPDTWKVRAQNRERQLAGCKR